MTDPRFIHLRLHTEYSVADGLVRVDEAVKRARDIAMPALGLSDLSNTFGWVKFYRAARGAGIKPVFGCDVWVTNAADRNRPSRLLLLVQHREGYRRLCELLTRAYQDNLHRGRAEIDPAWLAEGTDGLLALSGGDGGNVAQAILDDKPDAARAAAEAWAALFPGRYYLELQRFGQPHTERLIDGLLDIGAALNLPAVATHPIQFLAPDDFKAHEARVCIAEGMMLGDPRRPRPFTAEQYFKTPDEMAELFADLPEALANSVEIAKRCNLTLELGKSKLPDFPTPDGMSLDDYMRQRSFEGLHERMAQLYPDEAQRAAKLPEYTERLEFELGTIIQMGFPGYFLIVADFINWAKNNGVPVGPGRGSGAGSLVAYSLRITDLDPLAYDLLFERFLNPERVSMPDFDIDFCQDGRDRVIQYVKEQVRPRGGVADRHLRHHGGQGGAARRRPRARPAVSVRRQVRQAGAQRAGHFAGRGAREGTADRRAREERGRTRRTAAAGGKTRGHHPQRRHARGRGADRAGQAHRLLPAVSRRRLGSGGVAVRQGRRRGDRPGQVRLPRPAHADHPGRGGALRAAP